MHRLTLRILIPLMLLAFASHSAFAITPAKKKTSVRHRVKAKTAAATHKVVAVVHEPVSHLSRLRASRKRVYYSPWTEPTFADSTAGDKIDGEDLAVRRAAVQALGPYNGTIVAVDPQSGRLLTIVNQNLAFKSGFQPCSTIKLVAALAGLNEGLIDRNTGIRVGRRTSMNLTEALARSNNFYFATVGNRLGFEKVEQYAKLFGLGEKACFEEPEEQSGGLPDAPPSDGGVGMMTSFGSGITLTPLQLAGLVTAMANGGTLYYLQHPHTQDEAAHLVPKVKRQLEISQWIPEVKPGMEGAVEYGTARRASYNANEPIFGKTGTCSDQRSPGVHLGWFGSFNEANSKKLVVVVLLTGGRPVNGPVASGVAGAVYRNLSEQGYFGGQTVAALNF
jgi:cell division protein FtsI/penicillin-binding protein 2